VVDIGWVLEHFFIELTLNLLGVLSFNPAKGAVYIVSYAHLSTSLAYFWQPTLTWLQAVDNGACACSGPICYLK